MHRRYLLASGRAALLAASLVPAMAVARASDVANPDQSQATPLPAKSQNQTPRASAAEENSTGVADIVVTAQRRAESSSKVPIAVQTVNPLQLQTAGITSVKNLEQVVPGLVADPGAVAGAFFTPFIRGVGANSTSLGNDPSVAIFLDGVYQSDKTANVFSMSDIERIEVLKGPQGTLFGRNATGGAINIVTRKPSFDPSFSSEISYGNFDAMAAKMYVTGGLTSTLAASLAVNHSTGDEFIRVLGTDGHTGGTTTTSVSGKLLWNPSSNFQAQLSLLYDTSRTHDLTGTYTSVFPNLGQVLGGEAANEPYTVTPQQAAVMLATVKTYHATLNLRYSAPHFDIVSITGFVRAKDKQKTDYDGSSVNLFFFENPSTTKDVSEELQLIGTDHGRLQWVVGLYGLDNRPSLDGLLEGIGVPFPATPEQVLGTPGGLAILGKVRGPIKAAAGYGQATYALNSSTNITAGFRYSYEKRSLDVTEFALGQLAPGLILPTFTPIVQQGAANHKTFKAPTWRFAIDHHFQEDLMAYVSYNRGFKSGTYNLTDFNPRQTPVQPEKLDAYEVGIKSKWLNRKLEVNLAGFYYNYRNIQITRINPGTSGSTQLQNGPKETLYGLDAHVSAVPVRDLHLNADFSYLHAKYGSYQNANAFFLPDATHCIGNPPTVPCSDNLDASHSRGLYAPTFTMNLSGDYKLSLDGGSSLLFTANYFYTSRYITTVSLGDFAGLKAHGSLGSSVTWTNSTNKFYIRGFGTNLTKTRTIGLNASPFGLVVVAAHPRTYGVALGVNL